MEKADLENHFIKEPPLYMNTSDIDFMEKKSLKTTFLMMPVVNTWKTINESVSGLRGSHFILWTKKERKTKR